MSDPPDPPPEGEEQAFEDDGRDSPEGLGPDGGGPDGGGPDGVGPDGGGRARVRKAPNAFRTISEVADDLHIPQHVLRFWETKFPRVKPMKRGGGRRYYRPDDIALLRQISDLLYTQGYTIKGVQRLLREGGGRLAEDIPPPAEDERATSGDGTDETQSAGAEAPSPTSADPRPADPDPANRALLDRALSDRARPAPERREPADRRLDPPTPARAAPRRRGDPEAERLRAVLVETLAVLRAIRSLLP